MLPFQENSLKIKTIIVDSTTTYIGYAVPGTATSVVGWQIRKITSDANGDVTDVEFASGDYKFDKEMDEYLTYSYS